MSTVRANIEALINSLEQWPDADPFVLPYEMKEPLARDLRSLLVGCDEYHGQTIRAIGEALDINPSLFNDPPAFLRAVRWVRTGKIQVTDVNKSGDFVNATPPPVNASTGSMNTHRHGDQHKCAAMPKGHRIYFSEGQRIGRNWWHTDQNDDDTCVVACPFCGERLS